MSVRVFVGEREATGIDPGNRGLAYGDGLFETMRVDVGRVPMWPRHLARLQHGAHRLGIRVPEPAFITARIDEMAGHVSLGVLKLLLTRGEGGRGYASPLAATPTWVLSLHPLPPTRDDGLRLHGCHTRLAIQPALAGIKHCNRLEQVLARVESERAHCDEGLMRDTAGNVACATAANLLVWQADTWTTPPVTGCGVAGVLRGWLLEQGLVDVGAVTPAQVEAADALALCNAVRGILPVAMLDGHTWHPNAVVAQLQARLALVYPMFSTSMEVS